jgi:hypothetical protein
MGVLAVEDIFTARVHALAEDGELPRAGSTWFAPKKIEYSRLVEMTAQTGVDIVDFLTVKNGSSIVMEIAEVDIGGELRYFQHG